MKNLPTDLLRTFVAIAEEGGFSAAGNKLGRSQPAVSLQMNRLEALVDKPVMVRDGRSFKLTDDGQALLDYARKILRLNDEALLRLAGSDVVGRVKLGVPHEFATAYLPEFLTGFSEAYPGIELEVVSESSDRLLKRLERDEIDVVIAIGKETDARPSDQGWYEKLVWVMDEKHLKTDCDPVPLVAAPRGCVYRHRMLHALDEISLPWRIVYTGADYGGICAAAAVGLGVTVLAENMAPDNLQTHESTGRLPKLPGAAAEIHYSKIDTEPAVVHLAQHIKKVGRQIFTA